MLAKNIRDEYRKNNKCNKISDLETKEAEKGPEMSAKIALAFQQFLPILVTLTNKWHFAIFRGSPCPFLCLTVEFC